MASDSATVNLAISGRLAQSTDSRQCQTRKKNPHRVNYAGLPGSAYRRWWAVFFALHPAGQAAKQKGLPQRSDSPSYSILGYR